MYKKLSVKLLGEKWRVILMGKVFLSAFVVLSSLLYYMRRDKTDIFADRNEGKVLVMNNPFAQTNATYLLTPMMDMTNG